MISRIESTGRDATCADLIGNWRVLGKFMTWEFREDGTFGVEGFLGDVYRIEHPYTCDDSTRTATIPFLDTCAPPNTAMLVTTRLGAISEDRMMIYTGNTDASDVYVMERK